MIKPKQILEHNGVPGNLVYLAMEQVLAAILSTLFAMNGNQVVSLDCHRKRARQVLCADQPNPELLHESDPASQLCGALLHPGLELRPGSSKADAAKPASSFCRTILQRSRQRKRVALPKDVQSLCGKPTGKPPLQRKEFSNV